VPIAVNDLYILYHLIFCVVYHVIYHVIYYHMICLCVWLCITDYHSSRVFCYCMYYAYIIHPAYCVTACIMSMYVDFFGRGGSILVHLSCILFSSMYVYHPSLGDTIFRLYITSSVCYYCLILSLEISYDKVLIYIILFELFRFIVVLLFWGGISLSIITPCILCSYMYIYRPTIMVRCYC